MYQWGSKRENMPEYAILGWDSEVFGFAVAKILPPKLNFLELEKFLDNLKKENVSLVYWVSDSKDADSQKAAMRLGGFLTGQKITYTLNLQSLPEGHLDTVQLKEYDKDEPNSDLINLVLEGSTKSRFYIDPKISRQQYETLHKLWIKNSVKNNTLFIIEKDDRIIGFVSLNEKNGRGNIDFIVVDKLFAGKGYGRILMCNAHNWFISKGYATVQAVTQKENVIACKMYEKLGYKAENVESVYHFWL